MTEQTSKQSPLGQKTAAGWFYERDGQTTGPLSFRDLAYLACQGQLKADDLVWRDGQTTKKTAGEITGLIPRPPSADGSGPTGTIADGPPGGLYLPHLHNCSTPLFLLILLTSLSLLAASIYTGPSEYRPILLIATAVSFGTYLLLALIYLHRAWTMMPMFGAKLTGAKAISLLPIPILGGIWSFTAVTGWARLWNRTVAQHPGLSLARKVTLPLFLLFPLLLTASQTLLMLHLLQMDPPLTLENPTHLAILTTHSTTLLLGTLCSLQLARAVNFLAKKKT